MANKKVRKSVKKVELKDTLTKITNTAKVVNEKVLDTATEVLEDVKQNGKFWTKEITSKAKKMTPELDLNKGLKKITATTKDINEYSLEVADGLVEGVFESGKEWQSVASKAIKGGLKLADKQQDLMFDTLEVVKSQLIKSAKRFRKLVKSN